MVTHWLQQNFVGAWQHGTAVSAFENGLLFTVTAPGYLSAVRWRRGQTGGSSTPLHWRFWNYAASQLIIQFPTVPDDGAVGWQEQAMIQAIPLSPGITYQLSRGIPANTDYTFYGIASRPAAGTNFAWGAPARRITVANTYGMPTFADPNFVEGLDVQWSDEPPAGSEPPITPDTGNALAAWFDPSDATKPDGNVKLYPRVMEVLDGLNLFGTEVSVADLVRLSEGLAEAEIANVREAWLSVKNWLGQTPSGTSHLYNSGSGFSVVQLAEQNKVTLADVQDRIADLQATVDTLLELVTSTPDVSTFPTGWTLLAETTWEEMIAWNVAANLYVVDFTTVPPGSGSFPLGDITWYPRAGWWAELNGTQPGERAFFDLTTQQLHRGGRTMPGILLYGHQGWAGTLQAWGAP